MQKCAVHLLPNRGGTCCLGSQGQQKIEKKYVCVGLFLRPHFLMLQEGFHMGWFHQQCSLGGVTGRPKGIRRALPSVHTLLVRALPAGEAHGGWVTCHHLAGLVWGPGGPCQEAAWSQGSINGFPVLLDPELLGCSLPGLLTLFWEPPLPPPWSWGQGLTRPC